MSDLILDNTYLILLLPLWIFLIIMCGRFFAVYVNNEQKEDKDVRKEARLYQLG